MKDSTLIILGLVVASLCFGYLIYYGLYWCKNRFNRFFHNHNLFKSTLAMAAGFWGGIALLVILVGVVNGGMPAIKAALTINGLVK